MSSIIYNGHEIQDLIINGNQAQLWLNGQKLYPSGGTPVDPYNPLGLPPFTIRCKFTQGVTPSCHGDFHHGWDSQVLVDPTENVWDITINTNDWGGNAGAIYGQHELLEVLGANTTGVTSMRYCFCYDEQLTSIAIFDTSSVTDMSYMLSRCESLTSIPLFDTHNVTDFSYMCFGYSWSGWLHITHVPLFNTSSATNVQSMFGYAKNVESGALALYQQMSTQATPPYNHSGCFTNCGSSTTTGAAELAQIPTDWGGTYVPVGETYTVEFSFSEYADFSATNFHVTSSSVSSSLPFYGQLIDIEGPWTSLSSSQASDILNGTSSEGGWGLKIEGIPSWTPFVLEATNPDPFGASGYAASIKVTSSTRGVIVNESRSVDSSMSSVTVNIDSNMSTTWTWTP